MSAAHVHAAPEQRPTAMSVPLEGTALTYHRLNADQDARPPVLYLHPWFGCHQMWHPLAARLPAPGLAVDWYSLAGGDWEDWSSPHGLARAAVALLDHEDLARVDVIGNSVGGIVTQVLAAEHPERVRRIVLVGTGAHLSGPPTAFGKLVAQWIEGAGDSGNAAERTELAGRLVDALVARPLERAARATYVDAVLAADPAFLARVLGASRGLDLRPQLADILAPTLVIRGEHDTARTRTHARELQTGIRDARAVELPGCGHSPMIEDVDAFAALVRDHLDR